MIKLVDYIKKCLKNSEFKKYWQEDAGVSEEFTSTTESFSETYTELSELFESAEEYESKLDALIKNKGIKGADTHMTVEFYETENNKCPVIDFLESIQDQKLKEKTVKNIYNLGEQGTAMIKTKQAAHVAGAIFELRTQQGNNIDRIFYFFILGNKIILTNGYIKKTQKLDQQELARAQRYFKQYMKDNL